MYLIKWDVVHKITQRIIIDKKSYFGIYHLQRWGWSITFFDFESLVFIKQVQEYRWFTLFRLNLDLETSQYVL